MADQSFFKRKTIPPYPSDKESKIPLPEIIGPYKVEGLLEKGGMSLLYFGTHPSIPAAITIKVLSPRFLSHPEMTARFLKEAEIIALADHPNIVKLYGYGQWEGGLYIAMEFIQGRSLRKYLVKNPLSLKTALEIVLEIAYALCHLHTHGVIHRDLKPENILINERGHVKVIDFGIAQLIDPVELAKTEDHSERKRLIGTPIYMSPEQLENPESTSYPSDIYSLGIIAYELVLGKLHGGQVHLSLMPKGLEKILSKALQPRILDRYIDIVDFIADLSSYLHSPQFEKEKKASDQAGELFEKLQMIQFQLIPTSPLHSKHFVLGFSIHRPLGYSGLMVDYSEEDSRLILGESSNLEMDSLLHILYTKGLIDGLLSAHYTAEELADHLNQALLKSPTNHPLSFALFQYLEKSQQIRYLSCGYGSLWKISTDKVINMGTLNIALSVAKEAIFNSQLIAVKKGEKFIICPLSETGFPFTAAQFEQYLIEEASLPPQALAESLQRKAKALHPRYLNDHALIIFVFEF